MQDLALAHQLGQHADGVLDGSARVDAVLVVQVDAVGAQPLQRALDSSTDVGGAAVDHAALAPGVRDEPELRGDHNLVAAALDRLSDDLLAVERPVDLGGVDLSHPQIQGPADGADRLRVVKAPAAGVGPGHRHRPKADTGDVQPTQRDVLHRLAPCADSQDPAAHPRTHRRVMASTGLTACFAAVTSVNALPSRAGSLCRRAYWQRLPEYRQRE